MCPFLGDTNYYSPIWPGTQAPLTSRARQSRGILWAAATNIGALDTCKGAPGSLEHCRGKAPRWYLLVSIPREHSSRSLNMCVKLDACPISRWPSFTSSLGSVSCLSWTLGWVGSIAGAHFSDCYYLVDLQTWALLVFKISCLRGLSLKFMS